MRITETLAALAGLTGVLCGTLGAHGPISKIVEEAGNTEDWRTAVLYHLVHAVAAWVALQSGRKLSAWLFLTGILCFSGSIYVLAATDVSWIWPVTPIGGVIFLVGWGAAIFGAMRSKSAVSH